MKWGDNGELYHKTRAQKIVDKVAKFESKSEEAKVH